MIFFFKDGSFIYFDEMGKVSDCVFPARVTDLLDVLKQFLFVQKPTTYVVKCMQDAFHKKNIYKSFLFKRLTIVSTNDVSMLVFCIRNWKMDAIMKAYDVWVVAVMRYEGEHGDMRCFLQFKCQTKFFQTILV